MRKNKRNISVARLLAIYAAILLFVAVFWIGVVVLIVNVIKWAWGA